MHRPARVPPAWLALVAALAHGAFGCGSESSGACDPGELRCSGTIEAPVRESCNAGGTAWEPEPCPSLRYCVDTEGRIECRTRLCIPGTNKCSPDATQVFACADGGTAWDKQTCAEGTACSDGECAPVLCAPGERHCDADAAGFALCNEAGTAWNATACGADTRCHEGKCAAVVCTAGATRCSDDRTATLTCRSTGTGWDAVPCDASDYCTSSGCAPAWSRLGDVVRLRFGDPAPRLTPGRYAVAVVDTGTTSDKDTRFPLALTGPADAIRSPRSDTDGHASSADRSPDPVPARRFLPVHLPMPRPAVRTLPPKPAPVTYQVGDARTFHYPKDSAWLLITEARTGVLRAAGTTTNIWEDQTDKPAGSVLSDTAVANLIDWLDRGVVPRDIALYGQPTDVDGNGRIDVFVTNLLPSDSAAAFVWPSVSLFPSGTFGADTDFGEVVFTMGPGHGVSNAELAGIVAHEIAHLITIGRRMEPWLDQGPYAVPDWAHGDTYIAEGLANVAAMWCGHQTQSEFTAALQGLDLLSLSWVFRANYLNAMNENMIGYALGSLVMEYLLDQSGGFRVAGADTLSDLGGRAYLDAVHSRESGPERIAPLDGRPPAEWWLDLATALLVTALPGTPSEATLADARYRFLAPVKDEWFGGWIGGLLHSSPAPGGGSGAFARLVPWEARGESIREGGMRLLNVQIGDAGAEATINSETGAATFLRY